MARHHQPHPTGQVQVELLPPDPATDALPPRDDQLPDGLTFIDLQTLATILQSRPETPTSRLAALLDAPPASIDKARQILQTRGVSWLQDEDPHGLKWAAGVQGPTDGDLGRARLRMMLSAVQKGTLASLAAVLQENSENGFTNMKPADLTRLLTAVSQELRLERGEPTTVVGESLAAQQSADAQRRLIERLLQQRQAVEEGRHIPGVS